MVISKYRKIRTITDSAGRTSRAGCICLYRKGNDVRNSRGETQEELGQKEFIDSVLVYEILKNQWEKGVSVGRMGHGMGDWGEMGEG